MSDKILFFLFDSFPIALALIGIIISYHPPKSRAVKVIVTIGLLLVAAGGCAALLTFHVRNEQAHATEVAQLNAKLDRNEQAHATEVAQLNAKLDAQSSKIDFYNRHNESALKGLAKPSARSNLSTPDQKEIVRRQKILAALRNEYVLSHDNVNPAVMSGIQNPPADWVNQRLKALGEKWTISEQYQAPSLPPEVLCSINIADCSNQNIKDKVSQIADALDAAYAKYAEYQRAPIEPGKEHTHAAWLSTMRTMTIFEYQGEAEASVNKYRHELIRRLDLGNADRSLDYLYEPTRQRQMEDFREIARDLRNLAARLPNVDRNKSAQRQ
jgi:outer membrane murein-binding lipoprotein Lpp